MADIAIKRSHSLGLKGAKDAADRMADKLGKQFNLNGDWSGNTLKFERPGVNGALTISDKDMKLEVTLGFLLKAMKGPIERAVNEQLDSVLAAAESKKAAPAAKEPAKAKPAAAAKAKAAPAAKTKPKTATGAKKKSA
jgi:putative polyhydroxyalkanoate system protein